MLRRQLLDGVAGLVVMEGGSAKISKIKGHRTAAERLGGLAGRQGLLPQSGS